MKKRILSLILCACLVLSIVPVMNLLPATKVHAEGEMTYEFYGVDSKTNYTSNGFFTIDLDSNGKTASASGNSGDVTINKVVRSFNRRFKFVNGGTITLNSVQAGSLVVVWSANNKNVCVGTDYIDYKVTDNKVKCEEFTLTEGSSNHTISFSGEVYVYYVGFTPDGSSGGDTTDPSNPSTPAPSDPACEHTNTTTTTVDATCTEDGSTTVTCDDCDETISTEVIPATGHNYVDGTCSCGATEQQCEHAFKDDSVKHYRWTADYSKCVAYCTCTECKEYVVFEATDISVDFGAATCTTKGTITYTATFSQDWITSSAKSSAVTVADQYYHPGWTEIARVSATCLADGYITEQCTACEAKRTVSIPATHKEGEACDYCDTGFECAADKTNTEYVHVFNDGMTDPEGFFEITGAENTRSDVVAREYNGILLGRCLKMTNSNSGNNVPFSLRFETLFDDDANGIDGDGVLILITDARDGNNFTTLNIQAEGGNSVEVIVPKDGILVLSVTQGTTYTITKENTEGSLYYVEYIPGAVLKNATDDDNSDAESVFVAEIDGVGYYTLGEAVAAAKPNDIITLLRDTDEEVTVGSVLTEAGEKITICLHEHTAPNIAVASGCKKDTVSCSKNHGEDIVITKLEEHTCVGGDPVQENVVEATCTENGSYDEVVYCTGCHAELSRNTIVVPATGHTAGDTVVENEVAATCTAAGSYDEVVYCTVCTAELSRNTIVVPATGHTNEEGDDDVCDNCGTNLAIVAYIDANGNKTPDEGEPTFETVAEALAAAVNGDVVRMYADSDENTVFLVVRNGVTLDLNGHILTAAGLSAFNGNHVIDDSANTTGLLKVPNGYLILPQDNEELPVWNENDGYFFVSPKTVTGKGKNQYFDEEYTEGVFKVLFRPNFNYVNGDSTNGNHVRKTYFLNGGWDNGLTMTIELSWTGGETTVVQSFVYSDELFQRAYQNAAEGKTPCFSLSMRSVPSVDEITIRVVILSNTGVRFEGDPMTWTKNDGAA